jgi:hypothetical protein
MLRKLVALAAFAVLVVGCEDTPSSGGTTTQTPTTSETTTGEPPPEPTTPETTQTKQKKPSLPIATAPVGGAPDSDGVEQCASVGWLGTDLPDGTTVKLGSPRLEPDDVFELDQSICSGQRACPDVIWNQDNQDSCFVGARQIANRNASVSVIVPAVATCASEKDCEDLKAGLKGSQVAFSARVRETPTTEPTPTDEPSPDETPTDG